MISSAVLQIIAIVTMLVDHIGYYLVSDSQILRVIGRIAFPLFAFMLVEGFKNTRSWRRYYLRLLVLAVVTQVLFYIAASELGLSYYHNVLFMLCFALLSLVLAQKGSFWVIGIPLLGLAASALDCEYGVFGVLMIVGFYYADKLFANNRPFRTISQFLILAAMMLSLAQYNNWPLQNFALLAIIPIALYSGEKGRRLPKILSYGFYPLHILILLIIALILR